MSEEGASEGGRRLHLIQVLRGFAALFVVLFHTTEPHGASIPGALFVESRIWSSMTALGWSGVDFFFVLSGFIIALIHVTDLERPERFRSYALKRFIRIYPFYALVVSALYAMHLSGVGAEAKRNPVVLLEALLLWHDNALVFVAWTLTHEVYFYLVFSFCILLPRRVSLPVLAVILGGTLFNVAREFMGISNPLPFLVSEVLFSRFNLEFAAGCLCAALLSRSYHRRMAWLLPLGAILFVGLGWSGHGAHLGHTWPRLILVVPFALIILGAATADRERSIVPPDWLTYLGDASYAIYLTHGVFLNGTFKIVHRVGILENGWSPVVVQCLSFLLVTIAGCAVHSHLERPLIQRLRRRWLVAR